MIVLLFNFVLYDFAANISSGHLHGGCWAMTIRTAGVRVVA